MDLISNYSGIDLLSLEKVHRKESKIKNRVNFADIVEEEELIKNDDQTDFSSECLSHSITPNSPSAGSHNMAIASFEQ